MRKHNRLGIIHAYPSHWLIDTLKRDGWRIVLIGDFPNRSEDALEGVDDVINVPLRDEDRLVRSVAEYHRLMPFDVLLPVYEGATALTARLAAMLGLPCFSEASAVASRNKFIASCLWATQRIPVPRSLPLVDPDDAWRIIEREFGGDAVIKLVDSMNSQGVVRVRNQQACEQALTELNGMLHSAIDIDLLRDRNRFAYGRGEVKLFVQEYCDGSEVGIDIIIDGSESYMLGVFEKAPAEGPCFAESLSVWPTSLGAAVESELGSLAVAAVRALGVTTGAAHVEIRLSQGGARVLEVGLRPGGAYTVKAAEHLTGVNSYRWLAATLAGEPLPLPTAPSGAVLYGGIVYPSSGMLSRADGLDVFDGLEGLLDLQVLNHPGDQVYALPRSAQPHFCYYLLVGNSREDVVSKHQLIQSRVQIEVVDEEAA